MSDQVEARWSAPSTELTPLNYVVMYHTVGSQDITNITFPGSPIPDAVISNLLPLTTYSFQVQAVFQEASGTTGEFIVTTEPGMPLLCSHHCWHANPCNTLEGRI